MADSCERCDVLQRLEAVERQLAAITRRFAEQRSRTRDDATFLARALPVIGGALGSKVFTLTDLFEACRQSQALRLVLDRSPSSLGQLFARNHGHPVAGFVIEKVGRTGSRAVWKVLKVR